jgi:regulator of replication initiation timing
MSAATPTGSPTDSTLDAELAALEQRIAALVAHADALRASNETLRRGLAAANARNRAMAERVTEASRRLDALLARLPAPTA